LVEKELTMRDGQAASSLKEHDTPGLDQPGDASRGSRELLSIFSHDLRTPLAALRMNVQVFKRRWTHEPPSAVALEEGLDRMGWLTERALAMVDDVLFVSTALPLPLGPKADTVDLEEAIYEAILLQKELLERSRCDIRVTHDAASPRIVGPWHRGLLLRLFLNLLDNVRRHAPGSPVKIALSVHDRWARVLFSDSGPGLPVEAGQGQGILIRSAGHHGGYGLGLWIVRKIVIELGGELTAESRPGLGLTFDIRIPL
jgi:signal transduction histidine kinase